MANKKAAAKKSSARSVKGKPTDGSKDTNKVTPTEWVMFFILSGIYYLIMVSAANNGTINVSGDIPEIPVAMVSILMSAMTVWGLRILAKTMKS